LQGDDGDAAVRRRSGRFRRDRLAGALGLPRQAGRIEALRALYDNINTAVSAGVVKRQSLATAIVYHTVQPKAVAHPTDSRLLNRVREQLLAAARQSGIELRQGDARVDKAADALTGREAHALQ
jgi:hypothetical protein